MCSIITEITESHYDDSSDAIYGAYEVRDGRADFSLLIGMKPMRAIISTGSNVYKHTCTKHE